jgi:hypothetical protein
MSAIENSQKVGGLPTEVVNIVQNAQDNSFRVKDNNFRVKDCPSQEFFFQFVELFLIQLDLRVIQLYLGIGLHTLH